MTPRIFLVDLDGPLADLEGEFLRRWQQEFPEEFFVPIEKRRSFFVYEEYPSHLKEKTADILKRDGFFRHLPVNQAGVQALQEIAALGHKIIICTSDIFANQTALTDKRAWVHKHLGLDLAKTMIFTRDKTLVRGNYLIDDKPIITGAMTPEWEHIIFDQPFNREINDKKRIAMDWANWKDILL
jgi:5'-nucleotidase